MPPEALPGWLCVAYGWLCVAGEWLRVAWKSVCDVKTWGRSLIDWLFFEKGPGDNAFLGAIFALNAGVATVDSVTEGIVKSVQTKVARRTAEYRELKVQLEKDDERMRQIGPENKEKLYSLVKQVLMFEDRLPEMFEEKVEAWRWRTLMGVCAAIALVCLAMPYSGGILLLLALPVPLFVRHCNRIGDYFLNEFHGKCAEVDAFVKEASQPRTGQNLEMLMQLKRLSETIGNLVAKLSAGVGGTTD